MLPITRNAAKILATTATVTISLLGAGTTTAVAGPAPAGTRQPRYVVRQILSGMSLRHSFLPEGSAKRRSERLTQPDDITLLGHHLFTAFQNGVGPQGQASSDGNRDSTIVEFTLNGQPVRQWDIRGKCDGVTAQPADRRLIATVNEDANSSVYLISLRAPAAVEVRHYTYSRPLPHDGGTDAISIYHGSVLISASAPGTTGASAPQADYPAAYRVTFDRATHVAAIHPLFSDEAKATVANVHATDRGHLVRLALTDPDSNEVVPHSGPRFAGAFLLTSQGDKEQIYVRHAGGPRQRLFVLRLSQSVDDTAWATGRFGRLYATDHDGDTIDLVTGRFPAGAVFVAVTPCDANGAPSVCPAPPAFPANYLGVLNPWTGQILRVRLRGPDLQPQGLAFVSGRHQPGVRGLSPAGRA